MTATSSSVLFAPENPTKIRLWGMLPSDHHHQDTWHAAPIRISCDSDVTCSLMIFSILVQTFVFGTCYFQRCPCWHFLVKVLFWLFDYAFVLYQFFVCGQKHVLPCGCWIGLLPSDCPSDMLSYLYFFNDDVIGYMTNIDYRLN